MTQPFNIDREFIKWYYEETYPEMGSNRSMCHAGAFNVNPSTSMRDYWMREAYKTGAQAMWSEVSKTLAHWAAAAEGLEPELVEPCEVFDRARQNLHYYVDEQLDLFR